MARVRVRVRVRVGGGVRGRVRVKVRLRVGVSLRHIPAASRSSDCCGCRLTIRPAAGEARAAAAAPASLSRKT